METRNNYIAPARAIHPGEILREELRERGIKQKDFARMAGVCATHLCEFIKGKRNLNEDWAVRFEKTLGIPYKSWMSLQSGYIYDLKVVEERQAEEREAHEYETAYAAMFNIREIYRVLGFSLMPCAERIAKIKKMAGFDLLRAEELRLQVSGLYKHSEKVQMDEKNMLSWLILNKIKTSADEEPIPEYKKGNALNAAAEIAGMANSGLMTTRRVKECLNGYGISYIHVPKIKSAPIDAFSTMKGERPVITVTYRYNDMDKLAFDILHELCHIDKHFGDSQTAFIAVEDGQYSTDPREKEANDFARQSLIPNSIWAELLKVGCKSLSPHAIVRTIAKAAKEKGVSPSIAVARYKHDTNWYSTSAYKSPKIS